MEWIFTDPRLQLIGSRRYGAETPDSDYDFSAQHSEALHEELINSGFFEMDPEYVRDNQCVNIYTIKNAVYQSSVSPRLQLIDINVITHKNEELVRGVWNEIDEVFYRKHICKRHFRQMNKAQYRRYAIALFNHLYESYDPHFGLVGLNIDSIRSSI